MYVCMYVGSDLDIYRKVHVVLLFLSLIPMGDAGFMRCFV